MARPLVLALSLTLAVSFTGAAADERHITTASNVRLRSAPETTASIVAELPLGTELVAVAHTRGTEPWYHVRTDDGRDGWVLGSLTTPIDPDHKEKTLDSILKARLNSGGSFAARVQLFGFIERTYEGLTDREARGRFALYRLRSINDVFLAVPSGVRDRDVDVQPPGAAPYGGWIRAHRDAARWDEPGGRWMVDPEYARAVHEAHRQSDAADDIGWFYVTNGLHR
jgi:Bacterial SH3 domain